MQLASRIPNLQEILTQYLDAVTTKNYKQVEKVGEELTQFSKQEGFLEAALVVMAHTDGSQEKNTLLSSLIKNRFKYDYQNVDYGHLQTYYYRLCQIAMLPRLAESPASKNTTLTLAYIFINLSANEDITLQNFLQPLVPTSTSPQAYTAYFDVLKYIASELDNSRLVLDEESRNIAREKALKQQQAVLQMLNEKGREMLANAEISRSILDCFTCWADASYNASLLNNLPYHSLMEGIFKSLYGDDEDLALTAGDCLNVIISLIRNQEENAPMIAYLGINIVPLVASIEQYLTAQKHDMVDLFTTIVLNFTSKAAHFFANPAPDALNFLHQLVAFTGSSLLFPQIFSEYRSFWENLLIEANRLVQNNSRNYNLGLQGVLLELYRAISGRCSYSPDTIRLFQSETESEAARNHRKEEVVFKRRESCIELFVEISAYLSIQKYLNNACSAIRSLFNSNPENLWGTLEALLFSLVQPLKKLPFINQDVMLLVNTFGQTLQLNNTPAIVKKTFLKLFRALMNNQQKDELFVKQLFYYSSTCFANKTLQDQADKTFCRGCELNGKIMVPSTPDFIKLMQQYLHRQHIVRGVLSIICSHPQAIEMYLLQALFILRDGVADPQISAFLRSMRMDSLIAAAKFIKECKLVQPHLHIVKQFVRNSMPFLKRLLACSQSAKNDEDPEVEKSVKLVKHLMRCLKLQFWEFMHDIYDCVMECFRESPICSYVYLVEVAITVFGKQPAYEPFLLSLYSQFCELSSRHLSQACERQRFSLLLDDFVGMNKRFFIYNASVVLKSGQLPFLLDQCLEYLSSETPRVVRATYSFFQAIFMVYWPGEFINAYNKNSDNEAFRFNPEDLPLYQQLKEELRDKVHYILAKMLLTLSEIPIECVRNCIFDTVSAEIKAFPEWNTQIWKELITPLPNDILLAREKEEFMSFIEQTKHNDIFLVGKANEALHRFITTIYKRMATAAKRKEYTLQ